MKVPDPRHTERRETEPTIHLLCGLVAAGKTTLAEQLAQALPAVRLSRDEWMIRLDGLPSEVVLERARRRLAAQPALAHRIDEEDVRHFEKIFEPPTDDEGLRVTRHP